MIKKNFSPTTGTQRPDELRVMLETNEGIQPFLLSRTSCSGQELPNSTPFWIFQVPTFVVKDHTDIWNPNFTALITALHFSGSNASEKSTLQGEAKRGGTKAYIP